MEFVTIKNLKLNNTIINFVLEKEKVYGVFSKNEKLRENFLLALNGINKFEGNVLQNSRNVYDNEYFFSQRVYMDFSQTYLKTMNSSLINDTISNKYKISFNQRLFDEYARTLGIRNETIVTSEYNFSLLGTTLVNFSLLKSMSILNYTVNNPTININQKNIKELITFELTKKTTNSSIIIGLNSLKDFDKKLDNIIIFSEFDNCYLVDKDETIIIIEDNIYLHDKLFKSKENYIICLNRFSKDEIKRFTSNKIKYYKKNLFEIEDFME